MSRELPQAAGCQFHRCEQLFTHPFRTIIPVGSRGRAHPENCSSHLGGPGEPQSATRDPQGRPPRRPDGPDDEGVARRHFPSPKKG